MRVDTEQKRIHDPGTEASVRDMLNAFFIPKHKERRDEYAAFLEQKTHVASLSGFTPTFLPSFLFDFQTALVEWAVRKGRAAIFADCGLGKTPMQLVWAENVARHTNKPVLILTPLAVSHQTVAEAEKFGMEAVRSGDGTYGGQKIIVTNYQRLHYFDSSQFAGVVCDESGILKNFSGATRQAVTEFMRTIPYRLLCTATPAPNDHMELGTSSEALGDLGYTDMLTRFFKNDQHNVSSRRRYGEVVKWRLKGHATLPFWQWVSSWARAVRTPADLGFSNSQFLLPPLVETEHLVTEIRPADGMLFTLPAVGLREQREERKRTLNERCKKVAELVNPTREPALVWCHLNTEGDVLEKLIPDAVQVSGQDSDEEKEEKLLTFVSGQARVLICKPIIGAFRLNFQHCARMTFFPSNSWEQYYQGVRRCWRFGQTRPVQVHIVTTKGEQGVLQNLQRKAAQAEQMFAILVNEMNNARTLDARRAFTQQEEIPSWLS